MKPQHIPRNTVARVAEIARVNNVSTATVERDPALFSLASSACQADIALEPFRNLYSFAVSTRKCGRDAVGYGDSMPVCVDHWRALTRMYTERYEKPAYMRVDETIACDE